MVDSTIDWRQEIERRAVHDLETGVLNWAATFGKINPKEGPMCGFRPNPLQRELFEAIGWCLTNNVPIRIVIVKCRQMGGSTAAMAAINWFLSMFPSSKAGIIADIEDHSDNLWGIFKTFAENDSFDWGVTKSVNTEKAKFSNGSSAAKESAKGMSPGRSSTYRALCVTEAAYWEGNKHSPDKILSGILNSVSKHPKSMVIMESTANGPQNFFAKYYNRAKSLEEVKREGMGDSKYIKIFSPWFDHDECRVFHEHVEDEKFRNKLIHHIKNPEKKKPKKVAEFLNENEKAWDRASIQFETKNPIAAKREKAMQRTYKLTTDQMRWQRTTWIDDCSMSYSQMKKDYPKSPEEAFSASTSQVFDLDALSAFRTTADHMIGHIQYGNLNQGEGDNYSFDYAEQEVADWWQFEQPKTDLEYLISVDPSEGVTDDSTDSDKTSILVLRKGYYASDGEWFPPKLVMRSLYECRWEELVLADRVAEIHNYYNKAMVVPEVNNTCGGAVVANLRHKGVKMYRRRTDDEAVDSTKSKLAHKDGWSTSKGNRRYILDGLAQAIREYKEYGGGIDIPCIKLVEELENFIRNKKGRWEGAPGHHDDDVMSLAICLNLVNSHAKLYKLPSRYPNGEADRLRHERNIRRRGRGKGQYRL